RQSDSWQTIQRSHAVANGVFVAVPNRVGLEIDQGTEGIEFWGNSFIADPSGAVLAQANDTEPAILTAEVDLDLVEQTRQHWPFLRDRRVDAYQDLTRRLRD